MFSSSTSHLQDPRRLEILESANLLDTPPEEAFNRVTRLAAELLATPAAQINFVDTRRQFFKSDYRRDGPSNGGGDVPLSHSFCQYVVAQQGTLVVEDARIHPVLSSNGAVSSGSVVAYLGVPLTTEGGYTLGSLCAFDTVPRRWPPEQIAILEALAAFTITEIQLRTTAQQLQNSYAELQKLEIHRAELVDMLVHDLRNPLTSIVGGLDLIDTASSEQEAQAVIELARTGADALMGMVNEILDVSRATAGQLGLALTMTTPENIVRSAVTRLQQLAKTEGITVRTMSAGGPAELQADAGKLGRVLVNLLANAIQHSPSGGEILIASVVDQARGSVTFRVQDDGPGIPLEQLPRLFEKFQTGNMPRRGHASTGLGLAFCQMVVEAHGGTIRAENSEPAGAIFSLTLPLAQQSATG